MSSQNNIVDVINNICNQHPHEIACTFLDDDGKIKEQITYQALQQKILQIAALLANSLKRQDRVLLLYSPSIDYIVGFLACLTAGMIAIPSYPPLTKELAEKLSFIIKDAQPTICLTHVEVARRLKQLKIVSWLDAVPGLKILTKKLFSNGMLEIEENFALLNNLNWIISDAKPLPKETTYVAGKINSNDIAFLQYTSGTTNQPKGVMVSHDNLFKNLQIIANEYQFTQQDKVVCWLPPYHDMGLIGGILSPLFSGFPLILMSPLTFLKSPIRWLQAISDFKATTSGAPNFAYELCLHKITPAQRAGLSLNSWRIALNGSEPIRAATLENFSEQFSLVGFNTKAFRPCYGLAEATLLVSTNREDEGANIKEIGHDSLRSHRILPDDTSHKHKIVSSGRVNSAFDIKIVNPETKNECDPNEIGEIWLAKGSVTLGYWQQAQKTDEMFKATLANGKGPFLRTGDYGFIYNDELYVTGRMKSMMIIRGRNHYPHDIELIAEHENTEIRPGCCVAFSIDMNGEEQVVLMCELKKLINPSEAEILTKKIKESVLRKQGVNLFDVVLLEKRKILKTTSGKLQRHKNRDLYLENKLQPIYQMQKSLLEPK